MPNPLLLFLAQAVSPLSPSHSDIIVVGKHAEQELAECLKRDCPPAEDMEASLDAAVEQFTDSRYAEARETLQKSIQRNRNHAANLPGPVSELYATLSTVAEHEGDNKLQLLSARNNVEILRRYLGESNRATLREEFGLADTLLGLGGSLSASEAYRSIERRAIESGQKDLAAGAIFRRAWLALMKKHFDEAESLADEAIEVGGTDNQSLVDLREIMLMQIAVRKDNEGGNEGAVDDLAARLRRPASERPQLLYAPPMPDINVDKKKSDLVEVRAPGMNDTSIRFADVGYWIRPDGRTAEVEVLRTSGLGQWAPGILKQVKERRYIPFNDEPGDLGLYRIDRFTVRGTKGAPLGSRIARRTGRLQVHVVDLTETEAMRSAYHRQTGNDASDKTSAVQKGRIGS